MKAAIFRGAGLPLSIETAPDPVPAPHQVVIKVGRCGICGSDVQMTDASSPVHFAVGAALGHEYAGEIVAIGRDVTGLAVGDRVTAMPVSGCGTCPACMSEEPIACTQCHYIMGGFGEYTFADSRYVARLPDSLSLSDGALVEPLACGSQAVRFGNVGPESRVLVLGAGPIGLTTVYWARRAGCTRVVVAALSARNEDRAMAMGADTFLLQGEGFADRVAAALGGPPDVVFECAGSPGLLGQAVDCVRPRGTVVVAGMCFDAESFIPGYAVMKQVRIQFSMAYTMSDFRRGIAALDSGFVEPRVMVSETISLASLPDTLELMRRDRTKCKVLVDPWN